MPNSPMILYFSALVAVNILALKRNDFFQYKKIKLLTRESKLKQFFLRSKEKIKFLIKCLYFNGFKLIFQ
jgi:hypothetical protein